MKQNGFYFMGGRSIFFITDAKRITQPLLRKMCGNLLIPDTASVLDELKRGLRKATLEIKELKNGRKYYDICGEKFGGYGSFLDEGKDTVIDMR